MSLSIDLRHKINALEKKYFSLNFLNKKKEIDYLLQKSLKLYFFILYTII